MKGSFDDFETALRANKVIREIVQDEIRKSRPAPRYAVVDEINHDDRSVLARFIGEDLAVRIPYLDTAPATVGQEVLVTGTGSDRAVTGVRGSSDAEARIAELEAQVAHLSQKAYAAAKLTATYTLPATPAKIPFNSPAGNLNPYYISVEPDGSFLIQIAGDYRYLAVVQPEDYRNRTLRMWPAVLPADGSGQYDLQDLWHEMLLSSGEYTSTVPFVGGSIARLQVGDRIYINGFASASTDILLGSRFSIDLINPEPIVYPE